MIRLGLKCLVINADTIHQAQLRREDIWKKAVDEPNVIFLAPEQLISPGFGEMTHKGSVFADRVCVIAVDEAHLLVTWGASWRKAFAQIGLVRARFRRRVVLMARAALS